MFDKTHGLVPLQFPYDNLEASAGKMGETKGHTVLWYFGAAEVSGP